MPALRLFQPVTDGGDPTPVLRGVARSLSRLLPTTSDEPLPSAWNETLARLQAVATVEPDHTARG